MSAATDLLELECSECRDCWEVPATVRDQGQHGSRWLCPTCREPGVWRVHHPGYRAGWLDLEDATIVDARERLEQDHPDTGLDEVVIERIS
jgi:hypothetical protein